MSWARRSSDIELAVIAESARWGDYRRDIHAYKNGPYELYTKADHWDKQLNWLMNEYFPKRSQIVLDQLRDIRLSGDIITGTETPETRRKKAQEIFDQLEALHGEAVFRCEMSLDDIYSEPSKAAFYEVEDFVDRVLRSENVKEEWQIFISQYKAFIWPKEYGQDKDSIHQQEWLALVEQTAAANRGENMQFLH